MRGFLAMLGLGTMAIVITSSAFKTVTLHLVSRFVHMLRHSISTRLLERYLGQPYAFFLTRNPSVLVMALAPPHARGGDAPSLD